MRSVLIKAGDNDYRKSTDIISKKKTKEYWSDGFFSILSCALQEEDTIILCLIFDNGIKKCTNPFCIADMRIVLLKY